MAKVDTIDVVTGLHGKYGGNSKDYFSTNSSSKQIRIARLNNPYQGEPTQKQKDQMELFKNRALWASAWLNANKPTEEMPKGTEAYQEAQRIKRQLAWSNVRQVVYKYMDDAGNVTLPSSGTSSGTVTPQKKTLTLTASPTEGGTVSGAGSYTAGQSVQITASPASGYEFTRWSDDNTSATRSVTVSSDMTLTAYFTATSTGGENTGEEGGEEPPFS